jgi:hypothetical protein
MHGQPNIKKSKKLILKDSFPGNFPGIKIIQTTKAEIKSTIQSLKQKKKNHQVTMK